MGDSYTVFLPARGPVQCDCKGFIYGNGRVACKACKHVLACQGLLENRWLDRDAGGYWGYWTGLNFADAMNVLDIGQ